MYPTHMRKLLAAALLLLAPAPPAARADAYHATPKLVLILVIDQFRGDYLDRYRDALTSPSGFNLFLRRGAYFNSCYFDYANTKTAPGHASIGTGAYTDGHGIGSNEWWDLTRYTDRPVSSVEDERYRLVGTFDDLPTPASPRIASSPRNLHATTLGDEVRLATNGKARLFGVSLKDRAAILPSGQTANAAFWIDPATGRFVTSTYYLPRLPAWVTAFNQGPRPAQAVKEAAAEKPGPFYSTVGRTPAANSYELDFAQALIENEKLGTNSVTDVLTVSLSANDILGHQMGPDSDGERAMVVGLDRDLNTFFSWLDKRVGLANVMVALSADHGISPIPSEAARLGVDAASLNVDAILQDVNATLNTRFAPGQHLRFLFPAKINSVVTQELPYLALDPGAFTSLPTPVSEADAEQAVADALPSAIRRLGAPPVPPSNRATPEATRRYAEARLPPDPGVAFIRTRVALAAGKLPLTDFGRRIAHSYTEHGGWYVMLVPTPYQMEVLTGSQTTHFSPWSYDRHVPLGLFGVAFQPGYYRDLVAPVDIAPTFAAILGINAPSNSSGRILTFALRPEQSTPRPARDRPARPPHPQP